MVRQAHSPPTKRRTGNGRPKFSRAGNRKIRPEVLCVNARRNCRAVSPSSVFAAEDTQLARVPQAAAQSGAEAGCSESPRCAKRHARPLHREPGRSSASTCTPSSSSTAATAAIGKTAHHFRWSPDRTRRNFSMRPGLCRPIGPLSWRRPGTRGLAGRRVSAHDHPDTPC